MQTPRIEWPNRVSLIDAILSAIGDLTRGDVDDRIEQSIRDAEAMSAAGIDKIQGVINMDRSRWERVWNDDTLLVQWFGEVGRPDHVEDVHRRLGMVHDRIANDVLTIRVRPSGAGSAQNLGSFISPKTFMVRPSWIIASADFRAGVIIHELMHEWFLDQKIGGQTVYGEALAMQLAAVSPKRARRSAENYMQYCMDV